MKRYSIVKRTWIFLFAAAFIFPGSSCSSEQADGNGSDHRNPKKKASQEESGTQGLSTIINIDSKEHFSSVLKSSNEKLLMFDLYADWCKPCRMLSPLLKEIAKENSSKVTVVKIDVDKYPGIAQAFGVRGIPFVVFVKEEKGVHAITGVRQKEAYVSAINKYSD